MAKKWETVSFIITDKQKGELSEKAKTAGFTNLNRYAKARMLEDIDNTIKPVSDIEKRIYIMSLLSYNCSRAVAEKTLDKDELQKLMQQAIEGAKEKGLMPSDSSNQNNG